VTTIEVVHDGLQSRVTRNPVDFVVLLEHQGQKVENAANASILFSERTHGGDVK
jgi:hypothetical protein